MTKAEQKAALTRQWEKWWREIDRDLDENVALWFRVFVQKKIKELK